MPIKPPQIDINGRIFSPDVQAKVNAAIHQKAIELSQTYQPIPEPMQSIGYEAKEKPVSEEQAKFSPTFDIKNYSGTLREILIFRMNQMSHVNTQEHFWQAQNETVKLRAKLQTAYDSAVQKAKMKKPQKGLDVAAEAIPDIWMFGAAAYDLITEQGMRLDVVLEMSGAKLAVLAAEQGTMLKAKAETDGDGVYLFTKKSREK